MKRSASNCFFTISITHILTFHNLEYLTILILLVMIEGCDWSGVDGRVLLLDECKWRNRGDYGSKDILKLPFRTRDILGKCR